MEVAELATRARVGDLALHEHDRVVGDRERVVHVLLDDQQRRPAVADRLERAVHLVDDDRREPKRQLVGDEQAGLLTSTRASASMRCSPPDSVPASCLRRSPSRGKQLVRLVERGGDTALDRGCAGR